MNNVPFNPHIVPLLQGIRPYLGANGQVVSDGILSIIQLLASNPGQEAVRTMSRVFTPPGADDKTITVNTVGGPVTLSLNLVFVLFLILILLVLSGNLLALNPGSIGGGTAVDDKSHDGTMV